MNADKMELVDWFAGMALQKLLPENGVYRGGDNEQTMAGRAYRVAVAMMAAREKLRDDPKYGDDWTLRD